MKDMSEQCAAESKHSRLWWAYWRFRRGPLQEARMRLWWPIYYRCKRPIIKLAHRFNWHHMRVFEIEGTKIARCDWCGLSDKVYDPVAGLLAIRAAVAKGPAAESKLASTERPEGTTLLPPKGKAGK